MSTRDILKQAKPKVHACEISSGTVYVRALSGAGRAQYMALVAQHEKGTPMFEIAALALCEADGAPCYPLDKEVAEWQKEIADLADLDGADLEKIALKLFEVSGLTKDSTEQAEKK